MSAVNFGGLASGLDTNLIIESLLANQQRRISNINTRISDQEARKRAFNDVKSSLSTFQGIVDNFTDEVFNKRTVTSADESIFTATADGDSAIGEYEVEVEQLATRSSVSIGAALSSATDQIGAGTLTLENDGGTSFAVTLSDGASTLTDLKEAINDQHGEDLQASIIEVSSGSFQLVVATKDTGASLNIKDDAAPSSPSSLTGFTDNGFDVGGINTEQTGQDARIVLNGITITRSGNEIDDVLEGVTLDLNKAEDGTKLKLSVESDLDDAVDQFEELAKGFNDILNQVERVTGENGVLRGDSDMLRVKRELQSTITRFVPNIDQINVRDDSSVGFTSLSQLGFKTDTKTGDLSVDKTAIRDALEDYFDEVKNLFQGNYTTSNANVTLGVNGADFSGSISVDTVNDQATVDGTTFDLDRNGDQLSFQTGSEYAGITFIDGVGNDSNVTFELSAGLGPTLDANLDTYTSFSGLINDRTSSIDTAVRNLDKELERNQDRLENERVRLTRTFAQAEQAISTLQGLQSSLGAQTVGGFRV